MAGDEDGFPLGFKIAHNVHEFPGQPGIQVGGRFIGNNYLGVVNQGPGNGGSLGFSPGEPLNLGGGFMSQVEQLQEA